MLMPAQVTVAIDAMRSSSNPHAFMGVTEQGLAAIVKTRGNQVRRAPTDPRRV